MVAYSNWIKKGLALFSWKQALFNSLIVILASRLQSQKIGLLLLVFFFCASQVMHVYHTSIWVPPGQWTNYKLLYKLLQLLHVQEKVNKWMNDEILSFWLLQEEQNTFFFNLCIVSCNFYLVQIAGNTSKFLVIFTILSDWCFYKSVQICDRPPQAGSKASINFLNKISFDLLKTKEKTRFL